MISFHEAILRITAHASLLKPVNLSLPKAHGLVLAEDVYAGVSIPPFDQSAMDGYAFRYEEYLQSREFSINGTVAAGDSGKLSISHQQAVRIFTGAPVPAGLDTVVMQEKAQKSGNNVLITDDDLRQGSNVRHAGDEIRQGDMALSKGSFLSPAAVGFLAGVGVTDVLVYPKPRVLLVITGKELQKPGQPLAPGQVYESNAAMLRSALEQLHVPNIQVTYTGDDRAEIADALSAAMQQADLILLTGGVSVGDYDFVVQAAETCGVRQLFHKVAQRPGKPLYAGTKEGKFIFGLPGNPASVLSCFYNFVVAAIEGLTGRKNMLERRYLPLLSGFSKKIPLKQFLKASFTNDGVLPLAAQESFRLSSFSAANCLLVLSEESREFAAGETVEILVLPYL